jgi:TonB-dependent starch-binding outer membrane protein SusC
MTPMPAAHASLSPAAPAAGDLGLSPPSMPLLAASSPLAASLAPTVQAGTIQGRVVSAETGGPIAGAQIIVAATNRGSLTDQSGRYLIPNVPAGPVTVRVRMIGYRAGEQQVQVEADQSVEANFTLTREAIGLDEVVVTGAAGEQRRREMGTSMSRVTARDIEVTPIQNVQDVLYGRSPGVTVMANSGQPGAAASIRLRGNNSISQANEPLIYVDGIRMFSGAIQDGAHERSGRQGISAFNSIRPEDIERIEIVKGAAATTLYGTEASGGVIQIFTRRGAAGPPRWSAEITRGVNQMGRIGPTSDRTGIHLRDCVNYLNSFGE